jgi:hypothetical protein
MDSFQTRPAESNVDTPQGEQFFCTIPACHRKIFRNISELHFYHSGCIFIILAAFYQRCMIVAGIKEQIAIVIALTFFERKSFFADFKSLI